MPIYRLFAILVVLAALPYGAVVHYYWTCGGCQISGDMLVVTYGLLLAAPFVLAGLGVAAVIAGIFGLRRDTRGGGRLAAVIGAVLLLFGGSTLASVLQWSVLTFDRPRQPSSSASIHDRLKNGGLTAGNLNEFSERTSAARARP
jgi:hypothetical protein